MDEPISTDITNNRGRSRRQQRVSRVKQKRFLNLFASGTTLTEACDLSGLDRSSYRYLRENDERFEAAFEDAENASTDLLVKKAEALS